MLKRLLLCGALALSPAVADAASEGQSVIGYWANAPQTNCKVGPCFIPYGATLPVSGGSSAVTPINAASTGTTASTTATLAGAAGKTTYICGYTIDADATAATVVNATITGLVSATITRRQGVGAVATGTISTYQNYNPCLPASAANTAIAVISGAAGTAGNTAVSAWGYQQ